MPIIAYIALGSNLGDRLENIEAAIEYLKQEEGIEVEEVSKIYETAPVGGPAQGDFLNGVVRIKTSLEAFKLLELCLNIERRLGRIRKVKNGPRTIDLDILLYGDEKIGRDNLKIPHPRMSERGFVMKPLGEVLI